MVTLSIVVVQIYCKVSGQEEPKQPVICILAPTTPTEQVTMTVKQAHPRHDEHQQTIR